jgi:protein SCO1/2
MMRFALVCVLLFGTQAWGADNLSALSYEQRLGSRVPLEVRFTDEQGRVTSLGQAVGDQPTILALGYFRCPNLCGLVRADLMNALSRLDASQHYSLVVLSIDPSETQSDAESARNIDAAQFGDPDPPGDWHYLTGSTSAIQAVSDAVGFRDWFNTDEKQFYHPAGIVFLTGGGMVSGYLLGLGYQPGDVGLGLARAANGVTARALPILLLCFHYDKITGRYTLAIMRVLQLGAAITILVVGGTMMLALRRERRPR